MSLNKYMHPRNPFYNNPPDFDSLSKAYPEFSKHCFKTDGNKRLTIDFKNDESLRALCCTLLKSQFDLNIDLPLNHLIPRVPQRINYALWIEDLLERPLTAVGIDIGCGASCIFALIICSMNKQWKMIVSDIDDESIEFANKNVSRNNLQSRISINKVSSEDKILIDLLSKIDNEESIDFVMCNPPFFRNESELAGTSDKIRKPLKRPAPHSSNPMRPNESIFDDGEVGFVKKIIDESKIIEKRIRVYTSMLGKKESLLELKNYLKHSNILNVSETQFCQGRTMRWAIAWSFHDLKLPNLSYFIPKDANKRSKPLSYEINIDQIGKDYTYEFLFEYIKKIFLDDLMFLSKESKSSSKLGFIVSKKTWSNQRAKRRKQQFQQPEINDDSNEAISFEFEFSLIKSPSNSFTIELNVDCSSDNLEMGEKREYLNQILQFLKNKLLNINK